MPRAILPEERLHPSIREKIAGNHRDLIDEVERAVAAHSVVVVGMTQNPHVKRARAMLEKRGIEFHYLEYGGYHNLWRRRNALKMWTGWPTFPMCFHDGMLIGGAEQLAAALQRGELQGR
jgi:monothiol glutaredoxin